MNPKNTNTENQPRYTCRDCKFGTEDRKEQNLSIEGKATLIICSHRPWPKHVISESACELFQLR